MKQVQISDLKEFVIAALNVNSKTFVIYIAIWKQEKMLVYFEKQAQIRALQFDKTSTEVPVEYSDYSNIFLVENIAKLPEKIRINKYAIELKKDK